nr:TIGR03915 family putative DNA repair protein [uncultured Sellimonas sp.]
MKRRFLCTDTMTGILSAVYDAWKTDRADEEAGICLWGSVQHEMFCEYYEVEENEHKADAVRKMIRKNLGADVYGDISYALLANDTEKGTAILRTMMAARNIPDGHKIMENLSHPEVRKVFQLSRSVGREAHAWKEFLRFRELNRGILYAKITPKHDILLAIAGHFANRFPLEDFVIYDENHCVYMIHPKKKAWILMKDEEKQWKLPKEFSKEENEWETLWEGFRKSISISERKNKKLQRQNMPVHYRKDMPEYQK